MADDERPSARTEADLVALGRRRGYSNPEWWAKQVMAGRRKKEQTKNKITYGGKPV